MDIKKIEANIKRLEKQHVKKADYVEKLEDTLEDLEIEPKSATLERIPTTTTELPVSDSKSVLHLIETLEEDDDVQAVFHNLEMTDELALALEDE